MRSKGGAIVDYSYDVAESLWCKATLRVSIEMHRLALLLCDYKELFSRLGQLMPK